MNRLTGRLHDNWVYLLGSTRQNTKEFNLDNQIAIAVQKLAAYEDTGFEPKEIKEALEKQLNGGWISVKERLPERIFEDCLITTEKGEIYTSEFYGYGEECQGFKEYPEGVWQIDQYGEKVIAWQPLPEPYKEEINE